jgi:hypothetical protein
VDLGILDFGQSCLGLSDTVQKKKNAILHQEGLRFFVGEIL